MKEYQETRSPRAYHEIGKIFLLIAKRFLNKSNLINYSQDRKDEMVSDAVFYMCKYIDRFNLERKNPFSYFTTTARNACLQYLNSRKKRNDVFSSIEFIDNLGDCYISNNS